MLSKRKSPTSIFPGNQVCNRPALRHEISIPVSFLKNITEKYETSKGFSNDAEGKEKSNPWQKFPIKGFYLRFPLF